MFSNHARKSNWRGAVLFGLGTTALLFAAVPLANYLSYTSDDGIWFAAAVNVQPPPPPPPNDPPPPPEEKKEVEEPELKHQPPPLTLAAIDALLNPGTGSATADMGMGQTLGAIDALAEIRIFELSELDKHPMPIQRVSPIFPYEAKQANLRGWVNVLFIVDENGTVRDARIEASSHREFENSALDAIRLWKFTAGMKDGRAVRSRMLLPFRFTIQD